MTYFRNTTDASGIYRQTTAADTNDSSGTAVGDNLSAMIRNASVFRLAYVMPRTQQCTDVKPASFYTDTSGTI